MINNIPFDFVYSICLPNRKVNEVEKIPRLPLKQKSLTKQIGSLNCSESDRDENLETFFIYNKEASIVLVTPKGTRICLTA